MSHLVTYEASKEKIDVRDRLESFMVNKLRDCYIFTDQ